jgi:radical SAM protein with 4Fe4S-binding SPASM domain
MGGQLSVVFIPTWSCNCRCSHCFEHIVPKATEEPDWELIFGRFRQFTDEHQTRSLTVYWQGGEVLTLRPAKVGEGMERIGEIFADSTTTVEHHLQTNLLLYNDHWRDIIARYFRGSISSSLDYPNLYRTTPSKGAEEYNRLWLERKRRAERDGFEVSVITLLNRETLALGAERFYGYFREEVGVRNVQINLPFPGVNRNVSVHLDKNRLAAFLADVYDLWREDGRDLNLNPFAALETRLHENNGSLPCVWSYCCAENLICISPEGAVGQCDCWVSAEERFSFGNLAEETLENIMASENRAVFCRRPTQMIQDAVCGECPYWRICAGGCPVRAYAFSGEIMARDHYCEVYQQLFGMVAGRAPEIPGSGAADQFGSG